MILQSVQLLKSIKPHLPASVLPLAGSMYRAYMALLCWYASLSDRRYAGKTDSARLPPAALRYRVHGLPDVDGFLQGGKRCSDDIRAALEKIGRSFDSFRNVLDFGCGCGRTIIWFVNPPPPLRLHGTDIDCEAISWCRDNLDFAAFGVNDPLPPLRYPAETFDLVYAISVFTHLNEDRQFLWLEELKRVTQSRGIVLLSVHGRDAKKSLARRDALELDQYGFKFTSSNTMKGIFPDWYQAAYHTRDYVLDRYSRYFDVLDYVPNGLCFQDLIILQKP